jgi:hypothetical protein
MLVIVLVQGMKLSIFIKQSTTIKMESQELRGGRYVMKSKKLKTTWMQGLAMVEGYHESDDEDFLLEHNHHKIRQTFLHTSKTMAINNLKTLIPWSC